MVIGLVSIVFIALCQSVRSLKIRVPAGVTDCVAELVDDEHFTVMMSDY
jgi:hypothetical protein